MENRGEKGEGVCRARTAESLELEILSLGCVEEECGLSIKHANSWAPSPDKRSGLGSRNLLSTNCFPSKGSRDHTLGTWSADETASVSRRPGDLFRWSSWIQASVGVEG